jgi:pyridoxamine 5'-phosphate oxidase
LPWEKDEVVALHVTTSSGGIDFTQATDPFDLFEAWFTEASAHEINDPNAMALSTVDGDGMPNVRMVLLKGLDGAGLPEGGSERGFVFYTNTTSTKGRELRTNPKAAVLFHWKSLQRQVRVRGAISQVSAAEADAYYASRPRGSRIGAWASQQSQPLANRDVLEAAVAAYTQTHAEGEIPRPAHWTGFRLTPREIEFWHDRPFRLHDRVVFTRSTPQAPWDKTRLYP